VSSPLAVAISWGPPPLHPTRHDTRPLRPHTHPLLLRLHCRGAAVYPEPHLHGAASPPQASVPRCLHPHRPSPALPGSLPGPRCLAVPLAQHAPDTI